MIGRFALASVVLACGGASRIDVSDLVQSSDLRVVRREAASETEVLPEAERLLGQPLTESSAVRVALLQSPALQSRLASLDVALADFRGAARLRNPELQLEAEYGEGDSPELAFELLVDVSDVVRAGLRRRIADAELSAARVEAATAILDLAYETRVAFYEHQADVERLELYRVTVEAFLAAAEAAREMREAGNVAGLDVAQQVALHQESRAALIQAELAVQQSRERLQVLLGGSAAATWTLASGLPAPDAEPDELDQLEHRAFERSLVLTAKRSRLEALARRVGLARATAAIPAVHAGVAGAREDDAWSIGPAIEVELPLFDQGQGPIGRASGQLLIARHDYLESVVRVRSAARRAVNAYEAALARSLFIEQSLVPAREDVLRESLLQYNAMNAGIFQLLDAKRALLDAQRMSVDARASYWKARAAVELAMAGRTMGTSDVVEVPMMSSGSAGGGH